MSSRGWIIVTGGGSGIGRAIVKHFSEKYNILTCARRKAPLPTKRHHYFVMCALFQLFDQLYFTEGMQLTVVRRFCRCARNISPTQIGGM